MGKIAELFTSRKFWAMVVAVVGSLGAALSGQLGWTEAILACVGVIMAWITGQSIVDSRKA